MNNAFAIQDEFIADNMAVENKCYDSMICDSPGIDFVIQYSPVSNASFGNNALQSESNSDN